MTVKQLIERLQEQPDYYEVAVRLNEGGGDYSIDDVIQHSGSDGARAVIVG